MADNDGSIKLVADVSQFIGPLQEAAKAPLKVAASAEEARQKIVASYKAQVEAAKEVGASQRELESIAKRTASMLANVTEDSAKRFINSIDKMEDRQRRFNEARKSLGAVKLPEVDLGDDHVNVSKQVQFGSVLRGLEGNFSRNIRAAEAFGSTLSFLGPVVEAAFPIVGAVTLGVALGHLIEEVYEFQKSVRESPKHIEEAFGSFDLSIQTSNDKLRLTNDLLANTAAKLEGGSENILAIQLDEARIKADELAKSLEDDATKVKELLKANHVSGLAVLLGTAGTADVSGSINYYQEELAKLGRDRATAQRSGNTDAFTKADKALNDKRTSYQGYLSNQIFLREHPDLQGENSGGNMAGDQSANLAVLRGAQNVLQDRQEEEATKDKNAALVARVKGDQANVAAAKRAQEEQQKQWADEFAAYDAAGKRSAEEIATWWATKAVVYSNGAANFNDAMKRANLELVKINNDTDTQTKTFQKSIEKFNEDKFKEINKGPDLSDADRAGKNLAVFLGNKQKIEDAQQQTGYSLKQLDIQQDASTGKINKAEEAFRLATLHALEYADAIEKLNEQQAKLDDNKSLTAEERKAQQSGIDLKRGQLDGNRQVQERQDNMSVNSAAWASTLHTIDALNQSIVQTATTGNGNWGNTFKQIGGQFTSSALKSIESPILGALGLGKADGSASNPFYVVMQDIGRSIGGLFGGGGDDDGSGGGFFSSALHMLTGRAVGGNVDANGAYVVGERGPEVLTLGATSGRVTPNSKLGGDTHNWNVDARGANDPAAVQAAVRRGIAQAAPMLISHSVSAVKEQQRRQPSINK